MCTIRLTFHVNRCPHTSQWWCLSFLCADLLCCSRVPFCMKDSPHSLRWRFYTSCAQSRCVQQACSSLWTMRHNVNIPFWRFSFECLSGSSQTKLRVKVVAVLSSFTGLNSCLNMESKPDCDYTSVRRVLSTLDWFRCLCLWCKWRKPSVGKWRSFKCLRNTSCEHHEVFKFLLLQARAFCRDPFTTSLFAYIASICVVSLV